MDIMWIAKIARIATLVAIWSLALNSPMSKKIECLCGGTLHFLPIIFLLSSTLVSTLRGCLLFIFLFCWLSCTRYIGTYVNNSSELSVRHFFSDEI